MAFRVKCDRAFQVERTSRGVSTKTRTHCLALNDVRRTRCLSIRTTKYVTCDSRRLGCETKFVALQLRDPPTPGSKKPKLHKYIQKSSHLIRIGTFSGNIGLTRELIQARRWFSSSVTREEVRRCRWHVVVNLFLTTWFAGLKMRIPSELNCRPGTLTTPTVFPVACF